MLFEEENTGLLGATEAADELLVFGYGCKLFRDDEQAARVNRGATLIPWQGDKTLMIDRYDCRASLLDRSEFVFEGPFRPFRDENEEVERLCEEERYADLRSDVTERRQGLEEIRKRAVAPSAGYAEVDFKYSADNQPSGPSAEEMAAKKAAAQKDKLFEAPAALKVPADVETPRYHRLHVIMERTAAFVARHGPQMEIVLKAKQSQNTQFHFLDFGHHLNPYYRLLVKSIANGLYKPASSKSEDEDGEGQVKPSIKGTLALQGFVPVTVHARENLTNADDGSSSDESESDDGGSFGLHPSLFAASRLAQKKEQAPGDKQESGEDANGRKEANEKNGVCEKSDVQAVVTKSQQEEERSKAEASQKSKEEIDGKKRDAAKAVSARDLIAMRLEAACAPVARSKLTMVPISTKGQTTSQQSLGGTGSSERRHEDAATQQSKLEAQADHFIEDELTEEWPTREMLEAAEQEEEAHSLLVHEPQFLDGKLMQESSIPPENDQAYPYEEAAAYSGNNDQPYPYQEAAAYTGNPYAYLSYSQIVTDSYGQPVYSDPTAIAYMQGMDPGMAQAFAGMDPQLAAALLAPPPPPPDDSDGLASVSSGVAGYPLSFQPPPPPDDDDENCTTTELPDSCPSPPPQSVRLIIDKLAEYVARNGRDFEEGIVAKRDPRFAFVERGKPHHIYYLWQCRAKRDALTEKAKREPKPITSSETSTRLGTVSFKVFKVSDRGSRTLRPGVQFSDSESEEEEQEPDEQAVVNKSVCVDYKAEKDPANPPAAFSYAGYRPLGGGEIISSANWQQYDWQDDQGDGSHQQEVQMERRRRAAAFRDMMVRAGSGLPPAQPTNPTTSQNYNNGRNRDSVPAQSSHESQRYDDRDGGYYDDRDGGYFYSGNRQPYDQQQRLHDKDHFQVHPAAPDFLPPAGDQPLHEPSTVYHHQQQAPPPSVLAQPPAGYHGAPQHHPLNPATQLAAPPPNRYPVPPAPEVHRQAPPPAVSVTSSSQSLAGPHPYSTSYSQPAQQYATSYQALTKVASTYPAVLDGFGVRPRGKAHISSAPVRYKQAEESSSGSGKAGRTGRSALKGSSGSRDRSRSPL